MKIWLIIGIPILIIIILCTWGISTYNNLNEANEGTKQLYSDVDVALQRRADLIPNLVNTAKGYMKHEEDVIAKVAEARSKMINSNDVQEKAEANQELTTALNNFLVVVENYPDLKANTNFIQLQDELAGTENRIAVARKDYNKAIGDYNKDVKSFPTNILANIFGFKEKAYFEAKESANEVPKVSFE